MCRRWARACMVSCWRNASASGLGGDLGVRDLGLGPLDHGHDVALERDREHADRVGEAREVGVGRVPREGDGVVEGEGELADAEGGHRRAAMCDVRNFSGLCLCESGGLRPATYMVWGHARIRGVRFTEGWWRRCSQRGIVVFLLCPYTPSDRRRSSWRSVVGDTFRCWYSL